MHGRRVLVGVILAFAPHFACSGPFDAPDPETPVVARDDYPWLAEWPPPAPAPPIEPLNVRFPTPAGHYRVTVGEGSFGAWLRGLPVRLDRSVVQSHDGRPLLADAAAVVAIDLGAGDLQQCADSLLRLHAEYLWARGRASGAVYHFTSGHPSSWSSWVAGERFAVRGSRVRRLQGEPRGADHRTFRAWLQHLFTYAGTLSLARDSVSVAGDEELHAGDFFVDPGSPGHAVMVVDVAIADGGRRKALVGQGFTPAQDFHILAGDAPEVIEGVWFPLPLHASESLDVPSWTPFPRASARRFRLPSADGQPDRR